MSATSLSNLTAILVSLTTPPRIPVRHARALLRKLRAKAPGDLTPEQRARLDEADRAGEQCDRVIKARDRMASGLVGQARNGAAVAFTALANGIEAISHIAPEVGPDGKAAEKVYGALFANGTGFAQLSAVGSWAHAERLDERIREEGHETAIQAMGLGQLLANARHHIALLGAATGCDGQPKPQDEPSSLALVEARDRFRAAIASYARSLAVDVDERDPRTLERFARALSPIDEVRVAYGSGGDEEEVEGDTPTGEPSAPGPLLSPGPLAS